MNANNDARKKLVEELKQLGILSHFIVDEDCWYSCSLYCCNDNRKSDKCDCGYEEKINKLADFILERERKIVEPLKVTKDILSQTINSHNKQCVLLLNAIDETLYRAGLENGK